MGKLKPLWQLQRQLQNRQARQNYYQNYQGPPADTSLTQQGAATTLYYRSLFLTDGSDHLIFSTSVFNSTLSKINAGQAGLLTTLPANSTAPSLRRAPIKPTKVHWYMGKANPIYKTSPWGSSWAQYYDTQGGKSHYSIPFSKASGVFDAGDLMAAFRAIFSPSGSPNTTLLGAKNGRAWLELERMSTAVQS